MRWRGLPAVLWPCARGALCGLPTGSMLSPAGRLAVVVDARVFACDHSRVTGDRAELVGRLSRYDARNAERLGSRGGDRLGMHVAFGQSEVHSIHCDNAMRGGGISFFLTADVGDLVLAHH